MGSMRENAAHAGPEGDGVAERLCGFMQTHNLSLKDLAEILRIEPQTLDHWLSGGMTPPACLLALMVLFGARTPIQSSTARDTAAPHGSAFHSAGDLQLKAQRGEELLRRVRAI